jgi:hypothetical protein
MRETITTGVLSTLSFDAVLQWNADLALVNAAEGRGPFFLARDLPLFGSTPRT